MDNELMNEEVVVERPTHTRAYRRRQTWRKAIQRRKLEDSVFSGRRFKHLHQYSDGFHFPAPKYKKWDKHPSIAEQRRTDGMNYQE